MRNSGRTRSNRWMSVAEACAEPASVYAIAKRLGVAQGSLTSVVESLKADGVLRATTTEAVTRYKLTQRGRRELANAGLPRELRAGDRLLIVGEAQAGVAAEVLAALASDPSLIAAFRTEGQVRWIGMYGDD